MFPKSSPRPFLDGLYFAFLFAQPWSLWSCAEKDNSCRPCSKLQVSDDSHHRGTDTPQPRGEPQLAGTVPSSEPTPKILYLALELPSAETLLCAWPWIGC